ncbi:MAG: stage II sporulation protein E [Acetivibrio sp.]
MKKWNKRIILVVFLGFIMGRAAFFSMNPIGMGYFLAVCGQGTSKGMLALMLLLGMATKMDGVSVIKYSLVLVTLSIIEHLLWREHKIREDSVKAWIGAGVTTALSLTKAFLYKDYLSYIALAFLEGILVYIAYFLLKKGSSFLLYHRKKECMNNEELVSLAFIIGIFVYAIPNLGFLSISFPYVAVFFFVLCAGYKYGPGAGAVAGAICGMVVSYSYSEVTYIGILCILGICSGMFQEIGKMGAGIAFATTGLSLGYLYEPSLIKMQGFPSLLLAVVLFFLIPGKLLESPQWDKKEEGDYMKQKLQLMTKERFREFSESLEKLSKSFLHYTEKKSILGCDDMNGIFEDISEKFCKECVYCSHCWEDNYEMTYAFAQDIFDIAKKEGHVKTQDVPVNFRSQCVYADAFVKETNKSLEIATINLKWSNKLMESRQAVAGQLDEMAGIVKEFASDITQMKEVKNSQEEQILEKLRMQHIEVKNLVIMEDKNGRLEIHMQAKAGKGRYITIREAASGLGQVLGKKVKPGEQMKNTIPEEYTAMVFHEDTKYKVLTGVARVTKEGEDISGDNFSFLELNSGEMVMTLCDGMGSGELANKESKSVIDLIEDFMEAGFKESAAIHLINSLYVLQTDGGSFSTIDMGIINLFNGNCNFVKMGAAATFLKRKENVKAIMSSSLPAGIFGDSKLEGSKCKIKEGEFVIMMTDGVVDCFPGEEKEEWIITALQEITSNNPREIANGILKKALEAVKEEAPDDMTVIVAGIWEKP